MVHSLRPSALVPRGFVIDKTASAGDAIILAVRSADMFSRCPGCGTRSERIPWGLMDGLAVSVVPKERAGMATGIFSTTRVAGEGVALAVVGAILSTLIAGRMQGLAAHGDMAAAAQRLAAGDVVMAASTISGAERAVLVSLYSDAFRDLLLLLAAITLLTALVVFLFLKTEAHNALEPQVDGAA